MSDHQHVRIHLRQVIMVGHGKETRYAKVLTGIRRDDLDERLSAGEALLAVDVFGYAMGMLNSFHITSIKPHTHLLAGSNILSIESMAAAQDVPFEVCPTDGEGYHPQIKTQPCTMHEHHAPHTYHDPRAMISCPGF